MLVVTKLEVLHIGHQNRATFKMTPEDIERLLQSKAHSQDQNKDDEEQEEDGPLSDQERSFRVDQLKPVLLAAQDAWASGSEDLDLIADKLATGSRDGRFALSTVMRVLC